MRLTQSISSRNLLESINRLNERLEQASSQAASGKKYSRLHESPSANSELLRLKSQLTELDQFQSNADNGSFFLNVTDSTLSSLHDVFTTIYARGSAAANGTNGGGTMATLAAEIRSLRDQLYSLANTQIRGRFIFAGSRVTAPAYSIAGDTVTYQGDAGVNAIEVSNGLQVKENVPGSEAFDDAFATVGALLTAVDNGDQAAVKNVLGQFAGVLGSIAQVRGRVGVDLGKLNDAATAREGLKTNIKARQSAVGDADMVEVISDVTKTQTALQAAFGVGASLGQKSLMDYLG